jgi:hypothetical protein
MGTLTMPATCLLLVSIMLAAKGLVAELIGSRLHRRLREDMVEIDEHSRLASIGRRIRPGKDSGSHAAATATYLQALINLAAAGFKARRGSARGAFDLLLWPD